MNKKIVLLPIIVIVAFATGFIVMMKSCLSSHNTYGVVGRPAISEDGKNMTVLVAVSEATSYQVNGGYRRTDYSTSYWLKQYEISTGKLLQQRKIATNAEKNNLLAVCFGGYADKIWLHTYGLKAYSLATLEELVNEEKLAAANGFNKNDFPKEERFIDEAVTKGYIIFTAESGDKYNIDLASQKISAYQETPVDKEAAIQEMLRRYNQTGDFTGIRCDTINGKMYMLAKDSVDATDSQPSNSNAQQIYKKLNLYSSNFTERRYGIHSAFSHNSVAIMPSGSYINGMFLTDNRKIIQLSAPGFLLIMHNDIIGHAARSLLTAVDSKGQVIWKCNTGISSKINNCIATKNQCIIIGNKDAIAGPHIGSDILCVVDMRNGKMVQCKADE